MIPFSIILDGDNAWPDLKDKPFHHSKSIAGLAILDSGMASGLPSVALRIELEDGSTVIAETSARILVSAARAIHAKYPDLLA